MFQLEMHYEIHSEQIYQFLYFITFDVQLAEDLMQETFIRAYEARHSYRGDANVLTWLRTIARNIAYDHFKRRKRIRFLRLEENIMIELSAEQLVHIEEEKRELYQAIASLKLNYRMAIVLRKIEGLSIKEAAEILGWNEAKVKNNTERGMLALKKAMGGDLHG
ncbi:RNA polymerase sigma factor [Metasolibacillus meyeri]|uniref:RNA polymerase sigma factor n=1 Tax=Metasolibacillus meyeri TaxID=1071052 RepID=A0AAW9NL25_9BACL|nr:RNA polymerase sigma factor [Metasolibacillus meyeri]MEC1178382.1 RNA polymerase sigma factor [Metasolibacillus meyeri]